MKDLDNLAIVAVLGMVALTCLFTAIPASSDQLVTLIVGGLLGYLAKAAQNPQP